MKKISRCRCCLSDKLLSYLNLGKQPLANSYHKGAVLPEYPLEVMVCKDCFHSQLSVVVEPDSMFRNYLYVSGTTATFRRHCELLAADAVKRVPGQKLSVLDIACNDGTQLEYFRSFGCEVMGIDPAENLRAITQEKGINVIVDYWTQKIAQRYVKKFDIMTGTNVFAHVHDLDEFLFASKIALNDSGILILEFPYADKMVEHNEFDTVYHEHLSYFLVHSFTTLIERMEFHIIDVLQTPIHGGSIRFFLQKGKRRRSSDVNMLIEKEKKKGLLKEETYSTFAGRVKKNKRDMRTLLTKLRRRGKKIIGYGASAKGNTMLNYFKTDLDYIVDDNELKWGYKTPGRNIPVVSPFTMKEEMHGLAIVILSWNFYNEILKKILLIRGEESNDSSILYVPEIKELPVSKKSILSISA